MRRLFPLLAILALCLTAQGADDPRRSQVNAASANSISNLLNDIQTEHLTADVNVGTLVDKTSSRNELETMLQQAQQIGGPRWADDQTCQVRLEIPGAAVAKKLIDIASAHAQTSPLTVEQLRTAVASWETRVFSATGTSTARVEAVRPPASSGAWKNVDQDQVRAAVLAARQNVVSRVLESIASVPLAGDKTIGDALKIPDVGSAMAQWLGNRPVTMVEFRDDLHVEVTLSASAGGVFDKFRSVLSGRTDLPLPADEKAWGVVAEGISRTMTSPVGLGMATASTQPTPAAIELTQAPDWLDHQLDAEGKAAARGDQLHTARLAEADALAKLRKQMRDLPVGDKLTLGAAADRDPRIAAALDRALHASVHVYGVSYLSDGGVSIRVSINLRDVWEEIASR